MKQENIQSTVAGYIIVRLKQLGVEHIFGVPGDYTLGFLDDIVASGIRWIGNCNELNAGYAADGYARTKGIGVAVVTYGVGALSMINAVAGAYAEQVPLVAISGAPNSARQQTNALVHHLISDYRLQHDIFKRITVDSAVLGNPNTIPEEVDRVLRNCYNYKLPVYLELPVDMVKMPCRSPEPIDFEIEHHSDLAALTECLGEIKEMADRSNSPVILVGVDVVRYRLAQKTLLLVETTEIPFATNVSSKAVLPELHPQFMGIYQGTMSRQPVRQQIESSDCVISLGVKMTDFDTAGFSTHIDPNALIDIKYDTVKIKSHYYGKVMMGDVIDGLVKTIKPRDFKLSKPFEPYYRKKEFTPEKGAALTVKRFYEKINSFLTDEMMLIVDTGDAVCASADLQIEEPDNFLAQPYYLSIGYSIPATLGVALADNSRRPVVIVGDGAFQMTAQEMSSLLRYGITPIIFLLNNRGYTIERVLHPDNIYNDLQNWSYSRLPAVFGGNSLGLVAATEDQLEEAINTALAATDKLVLIEVQTDPLDSSDLLKILAKKL